MINTIKIKICGNINNVNKSRKYNINKYEEIKKRWDKENSSLKKLFPEKYNDICNILQGLKDGYKIEFISSQKEQIEMITSIAEAMASPEIIHMRDDVK